MTNKKFLTYIRNFILIALIAYLFIVWMYFKDNVAHVSSIELIVAFLVIPLILLGIFIAILWKQRKSSNADPTDDHINVPNEQKALHTLDNELFLYGGVLLPEGHKFNDIINNTEDVTQLSKELTDFDGIPMLIKPTQVGIEVEDVDELDPATRRISMMLTQLMALNSEILTACTENYLLLKDLPPTVNSAASMHPEWQQRYMSSSETEDALAHQFKDIKIIKDITINICLAETHSERIESINNCIQELLIDYGFPEEYLKIVNLYFEPTQKTKIEDITHKILNIQEELLPKLTLTFVIDSEINQDWIDDNVMLNSTAAALVPEEAAIMLMAWNKSANDILNIESDAAYSLVQFEADETTALSRGNHLNEFLKNVKQFIIHKADSHNRDNTDKELNKATSDKSTPPSSIDVLQGHNMLILADINMLNQPYDTALFMSSNDQLIAQGSQVNTYLLGIYMQRNIWIKPFISLGIFLDATLDNLEDYDAAYLLTAHQNNHLLWTAEPKTKSSLT